MRRVRAAYTLCHQQCQVLSVLAAGLADDHPIDYLEIRAITDLLQPVVYAVAQRLRKRGFARKVMVRERGSRRAVVCHIITAAGIKARDRYAAELGLRT